MGTSDDWGDPTQPVQRQEWENLADLVEATAAELVDELLDEGGPDDTREGLDFDSVTLNDLREAIQPPEDDASAPPPPPPGPAPGFTSYDTDEVEIVGWTQADGSIDALPESLIQADQDEDDFFGSTGIQIINIDTGELIEAADIPAQEASSSPKPPPPPPGKAAPRPAEPASKALGIRLGQAEQDAVELPGVWGPFLAEMKAEILAEPDLRHRAAYIFVFANVMRAITGRRAQDIAGFLSGLADESGSVLRSMLLERLAALWQDASPQFFELMDRLERLDARPDGSLATVRRSSIAMERLLEADIDDDEVRELLRQRMIPPETFPALVVKTIEGHATGKLNNAVAGWKRLAKHAHGDLREASAALVAHNLRDNSAFFEVTGELLGELKSAPRLMLTLMQREALNHGSRFEEAKVLKHLIAQDVSAGKRLRGDSETSRRRLRRETATRLFRLSTLLEGLSGADFTGTDLEGMEPVKVLQDAVSLNASNLVLLRRLERWARALGDWEAVEQALVSQASIVQEPPVQALIWERLAAYHSETSGDVRAMAEYLSESTHQDPDCLPALISMGQLLILHGNLDDMLELRGVPEGEEVRAVNAAWRRAELLEKTDGDPREILTLYRNARDDQPESIHLFFCVERALARLGDWRGLRTLYDAAASSHSRLGQRLGDAGFEVETYRLVVETFLEDAHDDLRADWRAYRERREAPGWFDEVVEWRVVDDLVEAGEVNDVSRWVEDRVLETREEWSLRRNRLRVWQAWLADRHFGDRSAAVDAFRELLASARGVFQRRFALQGLLRNQDFAWIAHQMLRDEEGLWGWATGMDPQSPQAESLKQRIAAELLTLAGDYDRGIDILANLALAEEDTTERATIAERAVHHAMRSQRWARAFQFLPRCFENEDPRSLAEFSRHLASSLDDASDALQGLDAAGGFTSPSPVVILDELELAYRALDWQRASQLLSRSLATAEAGSIGFRAFALEHAILVGSWGYQSPELTLSCVEDLWSLESATPGTSPVFAVAGFIRTYSWLGRRDDVAIWTDYARKNFTPPVAQGLIDEAEVMSAAPKGRKAAAWYAARQESVAEPLQPYYRWMAASLEWLFGRRDDASVGELAAATTAGDPTHRVGNYLVAVALRDSNDFEGAARQFRLLRRAGNSRPVQSWSMIRSLFHLGVTMRQPQDAIALVDEDEAYHVFPWLPIALELFGRSLRRTMAVDRLRERAKMADGKRALLLELAQILGDVAQFPALAEQGEPGAIVLLELLAAQGERPNAPGWNIEIRHADLRRSIAEESQEQVRRRLMAFLLEVDEAFWGSPWCPWRLIHGDLTRFGLSIDELEALKARVSQFEETGIGAEARLVIAREFQRMGRRDIALDLMPRQLEEDAISLAWSLFGYALDPHSKQAKSARWALDLWEFRSGSVEGDGDVDAELMYETGHCYELVGREDDALLAYEASLMRRPTFLPAQVSAGRLLIRRQEWPRLVRLLESQLAAAQNEDIEASIAFRLGYLHDRRLRDMPEADVRAEDYYLRVLRHRPEHVPSLEALLEIAYRQHSYDAAAQYLARLAELTSSAELKCAYLVELATICEHRLDNMEKAAQIYASALTVDGEDVMAFHGLLRTDRSGQLSISAIRQRLDTGIAPRETEDLGHVLFSLFPENDDAATLIRHRFQDHYAFHIVQLCERVRHADLDEGSLAALERAYLDNESRFVCHVFERLGRPNPLTGEDLLQACKISVDPFLEGRLIRSMHHAWREEDLEALGLLATARARRATSPVVRSAELTWMVGTQYMRGNPAAALQVCERLLSQYMDFLPAVKLAKLIAEELGEWESVVRWYKRDAHLSRVSEIANEDRLHASQVQRDHIGDLDAAVEQLQTVLQSDPLHPDAFDQLRELLVTRRDFDVLIDAYEHQIRHRDDDGVICDMLNNMADIAVHQLDQPHDAIGFLTRSLERMPKQRRRLRMLAELYEAEGQIGRAVSCYRAAAKLSDEPDLLFRLWSHMGHLLETRLSRLDDAKSSYAQALKLRPTDATTLASLARVCESRMELQESLRYLHGVLEASSDSNMLKEARVSVVRVQSKAGASIEDILKSAASLILHHPEHLDTVDDISARLVRAGREDEIPEYFRKLTYESLTRAPQRSLAPHFEIARRVGLTDRAFRTAAIGECFGVSNDPMRKLYASHCAKRRWPKRPIPVDQTGGLLPAELVAPFLEVLRISREGITDSLEYVPGTDLIRRQYRQKDPKGIALDLAFRWPQLYGLELRDVHVTDTTFGDGSEVVFDGGIRLILDQRWRTADDPTELLVGLGRKLAAWSMGVGLWGRFDAEAGVALFIWVVTRFVSGWSMTDGEIPDIVNRARLGRWLDRKGQRVAPYALEISGRFGAAAVERQFMAMHEAFERFSTVVIDDPGRAIRYSRARDADDMGQVPWLFLFDRPAESIRKVIGIAAT